MNETDKLIAAIFAATMTVKESIPSPRGFLGFYDACVSEMLAREAVELAAKVERKIEAQNKAWG
jgi:hypothetical protein